MDFKPNTWAELAVGLIKAAAGLTVVPLLVRKRESARIEIEAAKLLSRFPKDTDTGLYEDARPRYWSGSRDTNEAVLLLHGFSAGPGQFQTVLDGLEEAGLAYYAPLLTGFGLADLDLLEKVRAGDWWRDALTAYDLLARRYERISVVGHSMGAALAMWLAARRPVEHLILTNPYIVAPLSDMVWQDKFTRPVVGRLLLWWRPVYLKKPAPGNPYRTGILDGAAAENAFHLPALPTRILLPLWQARDGADLSRAEFKDLSIVHGAQDETADIPGLLDRLTEANIPYQARAFEDSGHNILQDFDRHQAARIIITTLTGGQP